MIEAIEITDWESHDHTLIELADTVTVIIGQSHNGKSGIVRAIDWVLNNRPVSTAYFPRGLKKPQTVVSISKNDSFISRIRNTAKNYYEMEDGEYSALRSGVPEEVTAFLGMSEINLQLQKDVHYMLVDTPGQRAKRLNSIAGLSEMDEAREKINAKYNSVDSLFNAKTALLNEEKEKYDALKWLDAANFDYAELDRLQQGYDSIVGIIEKLQPVLENISDIDGKLAELDWVTTAYVDYPELVEMHGKNAALLKTTSQVISVVCTVQDIEARLVELPDPGIIDEVDKIISLDGILYDLEVKEHELEKRIETYTDCKNELKDIRLPDEKEMQNLSTKNAEFARLRSLISNIENCVQKIDEIAVGMVALTDTVQSYAIEEKAMLAEYKQCPFCLKPM